MTEMIFDFVGVDGFTTYPLLRPPSALEKLTLIFFTLRCPPHWPPVPPMTELRMNCSNRKLWRATSHQRHCLRMRTIRWPNIGAERSFRSLNLFALLEELAVPLAMPLHNREGSRRSLAVALPASIERLEPLAYAHFPVRTWQLEISGILDDKETTAPRLCQVIVEHWMGCSDGPVSTYELDP